MPSRSKSFLRLFPSEKGLFVVEEVSSSLQGELVAICLDWNGWPVPWQIPYAGVPIGSGRIRPNQGARLRKRG